MMRIYRRGCSACGLKDSIKIGGGRCGQHTRLPWTRWDISDIGAHVGETRHAHPTFAILSNSSPFPTLWTIGRAECLGIQVAPFLECLEGVTISGFRSKDQIPFRYLDPSTSTQESAGCHQPCQIDCRMSSFLPMHIEEIVRPSG
jgi:hypothetical protein